MIRMISSDSEPKIMNNIGRLFTDIPNYDMCI